MKRRRERSGTSIELRLTPMIDVVFLLLIFFMVTAKFIAPERKIPAFAADEEVGGGMALVEEYELHIVKGIERRPVVVSRRKVWEIDSLGPLLGELRSYHDRNLVGGKLSEDAGVSIECEGDIKWEAVVRVLEVVREAEIPSIRFKRRS